MPEPKDGQFTHRALVQLGAEWLRRNKYYLVACECVTRCKEVPDVIGWREGKWSALIECKISRSDFLQDAKKPSRRDVTKQVGQIRYYLAPAGLIKTMELPPNWGLLEAHDHRIVVRKRAVATPFNTKIAANELPMLTSLLRRAELRGVKLWETLNERLASEAREGRPKKINLGDED